MAFGQWCFGWTVGKFEYDLPSVGRRAALTASDGVRPMVLLAPPMLDRRRRGAEQAARAGVRGLPEESAAVRDGVACGTAAVSGPPGERGEGGRGGV